MTQPSEDRGKQLEHLMPGVLVAASIKLLYAEDNPQDADLTKAHFAATAPEFDVLVVGSGAACLAQIEARRLDILLLDHHLPDVDGLSLIKTLRLKYADLPVVLVTGAGDEELVSNALGLGVSDYIAKRLGYLTGLPDKLQQVLNKSRCRQQQDLARRPEVTRILYVEDPLEDTRLIRTHFAQAANIFEVEYATRGAAAVTYLNGLAAYDLVLINLGTPDQDGLDFIRKVADGKEPHSPIMIVTAKSGNESSAVLALKLGAAQYIIQQEEYLENLTHQIRQAITSETLRRTNEQLRLALLELEVKNRMAMSANATKSLFLANMSHEIRSPLAVIIGFAEVMLNLPLQSRENLNFIDPIIRNAKMLIHIVNDILDLAKVESGKFDVISGEIILPEFIRDVMNSLAIIASAKGVRLSVSSAKPIPESITSDSLRLRQIILNIVGNAIKFSPSGAAVEVTISVTEGLRGKEQLLEFRITDSGIGITAEEAKLLFKPFAQADMRTSRQFGGTGLGLVLSKQMAEALGGSVVLLESTVGSGSTFVVTIGTGPLDGITFNEFHFSASRQDLAVTPVKIANILKGMEILVVDDGVDNQMLIRQHLQSAGAKVSVASSGAEGVEMATHHSYTLVLMDLQMPGMDGYEAAATLRREGYSVPIIALTAHAMKEVQEHCIAAGFSDYFSKPVNSVEFIKKLATYGSETRNLDLCIDKST